MRNLPLLILPALGMLCLYFAWPMTDLLNPYLEHAHPAIVLMAGFGLLSVGIPMFMNDKTRFRLAVDPQDSFFALMMFPALLLVIGVHSYLTQNGLRSDPWWVASLWAPLHILYFLWYLQRSPTKASSDD